MFEDGILWIPVEYLTTAFGLEYTVEGKAITITDGHLLPKVVLLECVDSAGLEEVIAERKAEAERIEAERKAKEEAERQAMLEAERKAAEKKAAEEAARRKAEEEAARRNQPGGNTAGQGQSAQSSSGGSSGGTCEGFDFFGGGDMNGNGSIDF